MRILIAYDGSDCAKDALQDLRFAGLPETTEAIILTVTETWLRSSSPDDVSYAELNDEELKWPWRKKALKLIGDSEKFALEAWERLRADFPTWQIRHETTSGYPEWAVVGKANKLDPDLIIVGSQGRSAAGRFVLGSVSMKVLSEARSPVRISRLSSSRRAGDRSPVRIIAGVDGSIDSWIAIETIGRREWHPDTEIRLVTALEPTVDEDFEYRQQKADELRRHAVETFEKSGWRVSSIVKPARAKDLLLEESESWNADAVFLGARGYRLFESILLGSVSYALSSRAHCSVEVVRN
jgi:nucleotide-binding universal stress UspA family protein